MLLISPFIWGVFIKKKKEKEKEAFMLKVPDELCSLTRSNELLISTENDYKARTETLGPYLPHPYSFPAAYCVQTLQNCPIH